MAHHRGRYSLDKQQAVATQLAHHLQEDDQEKGTHYPHSTPATRGARGGGRERGERTPHSQPERTKDTYGPEQIKQTPKQTQEKTQARYCSRGQTPVLSMPRVREGGGAGSQPRTSAE